MKLFTCQSCRQLLYFENTHCERCGHMLGYLPDIGTLSALEPTNDDAWTAMAAPGPLYRMCANAAQAACNWLVPADSPTPFCVACQHNRTIPDLSTPENLLSWQKLESAKRRLFYTLLKLELPIPTKFEDEAKGLAFDFLADPDAPGLNAPRVMTGHDNGLITINLAEADDAERERRRSSLGEPYRTILGHLRHEVGHYYWDRLVMDGGRVDAFRTLFGDERQDYGEALQAHYAKPPSNDWQGSFVSNYAAAHPWEDFAETWAHYLHIIDTLETARAFRVRVDPVAAQNEDLSAEVDFNVYKVEGIEPIVDAWLPPSAAANSLPPSRGQPDLYPFVLSEVVIEKLGYMHHLLRDSRTG